MIAVLDGLADLVDAAANTSGGTPTYIELAFSARTLGNIAGDGAWRPAAGPRRDVRRFAGLNTRYPTHGYRRW